jgi:hypothetical protein
LLDGAELATQQQKITMHLTTLEKIVESRNCLPREELLDRKTQLAFPKITQ